MTPLYVISQVIITLSLLAFAWFFREIDKSIAALVVGQLLVHWFKESNQMGKTMQTTAEARKMEAVVAGTGNGTIIPEAVTTTTTVTSTAEGDKE